MDLVFFNTCPLVIVAALNSNSCVIADGFVFTIEETMDCHATRTTDGGGGKESSNNAVAHYPGDTTDAAGDDNEDNPGASKGKSNTHSGIVGDIVTKLCQHCL